MYDFLKFHLISADLVFQTAALGMDAYNTDYAEHVKGGLNTRPTPKPTDSSGPASVVI